MLGEGGFSVKVDFLLTIPSRAQVMFGLDNWDHEDLLYFQDI